MTQDIRFDSKEDLYRFSELASHEDFGIYISTPYGQLDAKSLLALFTIMGKDVKVIAGDHTDVDDFVNFIEKYRKTKS